MSKAAKVFKKLAQEHRSTDYNDKDILAASKLPNWKNIKSTDGPLTISTGYNNEGMRSDTLMTQINPNLKHTFIQHQKPELPDGGSH